MVNIPANLQPVLWSKNIDWDQIKWLFDVYTTSTISNVFSHKPEKDYSEKSFNFAKNILLEIDRDLDKTKYVKTFPRYIG